LHSWHTQPPKTYEKYGIKQLFIERKDQYFMEVGMGQIYLNGPQIQLDKLEKMGDPFIEINKLIHWEIFRNSLESAIRKPDYSKGGRPPWDVVLMFKIVMLISWYNLSYNQAQYQVNNRLDFMRFLGVEVGAQLPDENTIWDFKEALKNTGLYRSLFDLFHEILENQGIKVSTGVMIDASFVEVPRRRVISESELKNPDKLLENESIQVALEETADKILVSAEDDRTEHVLRQTDFEARYTKKNGQTYFGYKDHAAVDKETKLIIDYDVTSAEVHDSRVFLDFIDADTTGVWADSAYLSKAIIAALKEKKPNISINICNRGYRNRPLTDEKKVENGLISKVRARVEHVFGFMTRSMGGMVLNCIGIERAKRDIGLKNLGYNIRRLVTLKRCAA
jgi:IS5 family transposase